VRSFQPWASLSFSRDFDRVFPFTAFVSMNFTTNPCRLQAECAAFFAPGGQFNRKNQNQKES